MNEHVYRQPLYLIFVINALEAGIGNTLKGVVSDIKLGEQEKNMGGQFHDSKHS